VILPGVPVPTIAGLGSRTGCTGFAAAAAFTILRLPALQMPVSLLSEAEAAAPAPGARHTRTSAGLLLVSLLLGDMDISTLWLAYAVCS
jgi:hypothetical protein